MTRLPIVILLLGSLLLWPAPGDAEPALASYFKNKELVTAPVRGNGVCGKVFYQKKEVLLEVHKWPPQFKAFLIRELKRFPLKDEILPFIDAIYLAHFLEEEDNDEEVHELQGLTCPNTESGSYVVVINAALATTRNQNPPYLAANGIYDDPIAIKAGGLSLQSGDVALRTFFHELFHVYDLAVLAKQKGGAAVWSVRQEFRRLAWHDDLRPKFPVRTHGGEELLAAYEALKKSSFFTLHGALNPYEDFAETLEAYYMGTRYKQWNAISLQEAGGSRFIWDVKAVLSRSRRHAEKLVFVGKYIFGEDFFDAL